MCSGHHFDSLPKCSTCTKPVSKKNACVVDGVVLHRRCVNNRKCCICLCAIHPDHDYLTPCGHHMHQACFSKWRMVHLTPAHAVVPCPMCRYATERVYTLTMSDTKQLVFVVSEPLSVRAIDRLQVMAAQEFSAGRDMNEIHSAIQCVLDTVEREHEGSALLQPLSSGLQGTA